MSNKTYDILKWIALVFLPAFTTFFGVIGATCAIPHTQEILTILVAFDTFIGTLLGVSSSAYRKSDEPDFPIGELTFEEDVDDGK